MKKLLVILAVLALLSPLSALAGDWQGPHKIEGMLYGPSSSSSPRSLPVKALLSNGVVLRIPTGYQQGSTPMADLILHAYKEGIEVYYRVETRTDYSGGYALSVGMDPRGVPGLE